MDAGPTRATQAIVGWRTDGYDGGPHGSYDGCYEPPMEEMK